MATSALYRWGYVNIKKSPEVIVLLTPVAAASVFALYKMYDKATFDQDLRWRADKGRIESFEDRFSVPTESMQKVPVSNTTPFLPTRPISRETNQPII
ncbi:hypothetical protein HDU93_006861 [Gonapodya sp. JEL0774]|nr:hypothetical protein HDU93_006861 [Gonapodya sp. JEL0774]